MLAWLVSADGNIDEIEVDVHGVVMLPDDYLLRLINVLSGLVDDDSS